MRFFKLGQLNNRLADKVFWYVVGIVGLKKTDVILTSFPKSGNTWVRFFFCNIISLSKWAARPVDFKTLNSTMPELGVSNLLRKWPYIDILPRIVKTHMGYLLFFRNKKVIMIMRDPRDVMVSFYFYQKRMKHNPEISFPDFIRHPKYGLPGWFRYHQSWQGKDKKVFKYEDIQLNDLAEFTRMIDCMGINISKDILNRAVEMSRFEKVRRNEVKYGHSNPQLNKNSLLFIRKGIVGDWENHFSRQDIAYYKKLVRQFALPDFSYDF